MWQRPRCNKAMLPFDKAHYLRKRLVLHMIQGADLFLEGAPVFGHRLNLREDLEKGRCFDSHHMMNVCNRGASSSCEIERDEETPEVGSARPGQGSYEQLSGVWSYDMEMHDPCHLCNLHLPSPCKRSHLPSGFPQLPGSKPARSCSLQIAELLEVQMAPSCTSLILST